MRTKRSGLNSVFCAAYAALVLLTSLWLGTASGQSIDARYASMSASVRAALSAAVRDHTNSRPSSLTQNPGYAHWQQKMSTRLSHWIADPSQREELLSLVYYESRRAGLEPQLVLSVIEVESGFRKYAISHANARGYMQVMPFWIQVIGREGDNLFHIRTNLRYGCTILRHYLDLEEGNLVRTLARYNGSLGQTWYPKRVERAWQRHWTYEPVIDVADTSSNLPIYGP